MSAFSQAAASSLMDIIGPIATTSPLPQEGNIQHYNGWSCVNCGVADDDVVISLKICTGCRYVKYCGRNCQQLHRKAHKGFCKRENQLRGKSPDAAAEIVDASYWKSRRYGENYVNIEHIMNDIQRHLFQCSHDFFFERKKNIIIGNVHDNMGDGDLVSVPHDEKLVPAWKRLAYTMAHSNTGMIEVFAIHHVDLTKQVLEILSSSLKRLKIKRLAFKDNKMDNDCIRVVTEIIESNLSIEEFDCEFNRPDDIAVNRKLMAAVEAHPNLEIYKTCSLSRTFSPLSDKEE